MKFLISLIFFIFLNSCAAIAVSQTSIYISNINGSDSNTCGQSIESPCKTIQGSFLSLENQFSKDFGLFPTYYQTTFYFYPSTYTTNSTINMDGYNAIFQPYPNTKGTVYFNGNGIGNGIISPTWFTSTLNNNLTLTFNNISSTDCRVSNGFTSFLINTNNYGTPTVSINFNNCNFICQNGINIPIISVSNGTTIIQDYSDLSYQYQINFNDCSFGSLVTNTTINNPFIYTNVPVILSLESCSFYNINSTSKSSLININNGILSIKDTTYYSMIELFILQSNNSKVTLDSITDDNSGSKYDYGMLNLNYAIFSFVNLNIDTSINNVNLVSLISIDNSFGSFESLSITTYDFIFNPLSFASNCSNTYLVNSDNSNILFVDSYLNCCGPAIYSASSIITVNDNYFPYTFSPAMKCDKDTVSTFIGSNVKEFDTDGCTGRGKVGFIVGLIILGVAVAILAIGSIVLLRKNHHYRHNSYNPIH